MIWVSLGIVRSARVGAPFVAAAAVLFATGCAPQPADDPPVAAEVTDTVPQDTRYTREYLFVGMSDRGPVTASLDFTNVHRGAHLHRTARGWLARGEEWDRFLDTRWATTAAGGVWRIVPNGGLTVLAGGPEEIEALAYRRGDRTLRLYPGQAVWSWERRDEHRVSARRGVLEIADQPVPGFVIESLLIEPPESPLRRSGVTFDRAVLTDGDQRVFVLGDGSGEDGTKNVGWGVLAGIEHRWESVDLRWLHVQPEAQARRDVPVQWSVQIEDAGIEGELVSLGFDLELGPDRPARRAVEMQHAVEGWLVVDGERISVFGAVRHVQR